MNELKKYLNKLGYEKFNGIQEDVIKSLLNGKDTIALMATGGGKTLCYQLPAFMLEGWVLIISPIVALMEDQVNRARSLGLKAETINSSIDKNEREQKLESIIINDNGLLFLSPEMIQNENILKKMKKKPPLFCVFDEAHCISTWGRDFRPTYAEVGKVLNTIMDENNIIIPKLALTATASKEIVDDIIKLSWMDNPNIISSSMVRKNIAISVSFQNNHEEVLKCIHEEVSLNLPGCIIIYCLTRNDCNLISDYLHKFNIDNVVHHSGLESHIRQANSKRFMDGHTNIMIATLGFGMGIDRNDVSCVIHSGIPGTAEAWYQEIGRAGRNGQESYTIGHVEPGITQNIRLANAKRDNAYNYSLKMSEAIFSNKCRMKSLLKCFDEDQENCGKCDNCLNLNKKIYIPDSIVADMLYKIKNNGLMSIEEFTEGNSLYLRYMDVLFTYGYIDYDIQNKMYGMPDFFICLTQKGWETINRNQFNEHLFIMETQIPWSCQEQLTQSEYKRFKIKAKEARLAFITKKPASYNECIQYAKKRDTTLQNIDFNNISFNKTGIIQKKGIRTLKF